MCAISFDQLRRDTLEERLKYLVRLGLVCHRAGVRGLGALGLQGFFESRDYVGGGGGMGGSPATSRLEMLRVASQAMFQCCCAIRLCDTASSWQLAPRTRTNIPVCHVTELISRTYGENEWWAVIVKDQ